MIKFFSKENIYFCSKFNQTSFGVQKQPSRRVLGKRCSGNMQQIYKIPPMPKCDFNKVAKQSNSNEITLWHRCSTVNLLHLFRTSFPKNNFGRLLLDVLNKHPPLKNKRLRSNHTFFFIIIVKSQKQSPSGAL